MSQVRIDLQKALSKWTPILENIGVNKEDREKYSWMSEYAEYHAVNENAYLNASTNGMGAVLAPQVGTYPGTTIGANYGSSNIGSGDLGQNLLPVAMKIAAQTIGLDLVAVKPTPGPKIDLVYVDFQYDDLNLNNFNTKPQVFKIQFAGSTGLSASFNNVITNYLNNITSNGIGAAIQQVQGGLALGSRVWTSFTQSAPANSVGTILANTSGTDYTGSKYGVLEFLGFSRIDGQPIFRAYKESNAAGGAYGGGVVYGLNQANNSFSVSATYSASGSMLSEITSLFGVNVAGAITGINLVSALEDQLPGYVTNFNGNGGQYPMSRQDEENTYAGAIGPKISSKSITVGTVEVSSALRRTEIEDIKANTGMDIVQKMESILVNELSQTISKQIVAKVFEMGNLNRATAPVFGGVSTITGQTIFDLDTTYVQAGPGGETTHAVQRKLITKLVHASNFIATEGRVGPAQYAVTNGGLGAALMDVAGYTINPLKSKLNTNGQMYPVGQIGDITIYVDPYMKYNDNRILIGRKNNPDQPGICFVPFLMAQSISIMSEATFAPRMILRSRYAVAELGFFPQKQFMTIYVNDANGYLN
jgi:hypothetical protein